MSYMKIVFIKSIAIDVSNSYYAKRIQKIHACFHKRIQKIHTCLSYVAKQYALRIHYFRLSAYALSCHFHVCVIMPQDVILLFEIANMV